MQATRRRPAQSPAQRRQPPRPTSRRQAAPIRRRRIRKWPWAVAVFAVILLWIPTIAWVGGAFASNGAEPAASDDALEKVLEGGAEAVDGVTEQGDELTDLAESHNLAWRDEDFAVDPYNQAEWNFESNGRKVVYLTIDDGPSENTQAVLDILDKYHCKATFFVTGIEPDYAYQIAEEYRRGHTVGLHTYSHDYAQVYASIDSYFWDLEQIGEVVRQQIGYVPCFIRFPGGSSNAISANYTPGIMSALVDKVQAEGYQYYDWNASCGDGDVHTADELYAYACEFDDQENVVLLCHDSATKQATVEALPRIIEHYQALGYTFEAIDRTTMVPHHGVNN